jgi:hypothetical protein
MHGGLRLLWTEDHLEEAPMREVDLFLRRNHFWIAVLKEVWLPEAFRTLYFLGYLRRGL